MILGHVVARRDAAAAAAAASDAAARIDASDYGAILDVRDQ